MRYAGKSSEQHNSDYNRPGLGFPFWSSYVMKTVLGFRRQIQPGASVVREFCHAKIVSQASKRKTGLYKMPAEV
jgi:hypothetical protein